MKITKTQLQRIIKEELSLVLKEAEQTGLSGIGQTMRRGARKMVGGAGPLQKYLDILLQARALMQEAFEGEVTRADAMVSIPESYAKYVAENWERIVKTLLQAQELSSTQSLGGFAAEMGMGVEFIDAVGPAIANVEGAYRQAAERKIKKSMKYMRKAIATIDAAENAAAGEI